MKKFFKKNVYRIILSAVMVACCGVTALANDTSKELSEMSDYHQ